MAGYARPEKPKARQASLAGFLHWCPMIEINVTSDFNRLAQRLRAMGNQHVQQATSDALNSVARNIREKSGPEEMRKVFDRPTPWALRSIFFRQSTPQTLRASVGLGRDTYSKSRLTPEELLGHQIIGGGRREKGVESYLRQRGLISDGEFVRPGAGARLDRYGNMSRGQTMQLISQLKIGIDPYQNKSKSKRSKAHQHKAGHIFWARRGDGYNLTTGAWISLERGKVLPLLVVIKAPHYKAKFDLKKLVEQTLASRFDKQFRYFYRRELKRAGLA